VFWGRQESNHRVQEGLHAHVLERAAAQSYQIAALKEKQVTCKIMLKIAPRAGAFDKRSLPDVGNRKYFKKLRFFIFLRILTNLDQPWLS
jgi:hypothetical protein